MHFGRCPVFTIVDLQDGQIVSKEIVTNPGHEPGRIPQFLQKHGAQCIICGGMGMRAAGYFNELGIQTLAGVSGTIDEVLEKLKNGTLEGGESLCRPGAGKGYGIEKTICDHPEEKESGK